MRESVCPHRSPLADTHTREVTFQQPKLREVGYNWWSAASFDRGALAGRLRWARRSSAAPAARPRTPRAIDTSRCFGLSAPSSAPGPEIVAMVMMQAL